MAITFSARLQARLNKCCKAYCKAPAIGPSIMFECRTVSELVSYLLQQLSQSQNLEMGWSSPESTKNLPHRSSNDPLVVRHVVSLGTLCMTAQAHVKNKAFAIKAFSMFFIRALNGCFSVANLNTWNHRD